MRRYEVFDRRLQLKVELPGAYRNGESGFDPKQNPSLRPRRRIRSRSKPSLAPIPAEIQADSAL